MAELRAWLQHPRRQLVAVLVLGPLYVAYVLLILGSALRLVGMLP